MKCNQGKPIRTRLRTIEAVSSKPQRWRRGRDFKRRNVTANRNLFMQRAPTNNARRGSTILKNKDKDKIVGNCNSSVLLRWFNPFFHFLAFLQNFHLLFFIFANSFALESQFWRRQFFDPIGVFELTFSIFLG